MEGMEGMEEMEEMEEVEAGRRRTRLAEHLWQTSRHMYRLF
jgi:hypothetical protein